MYLVLLLKGYHLKKWQRKTLHAFSVTVRPSSIPIIQRLHMFMLCPFIFCLNFSLTFTEWSNLSTLSSIRTLCFRHDPFCWWSFLPRVLIGWSTFSLPTSFQFEFSRTSQRSFVCFCFLFLIEQSQFPTFAWHLELQPLCKAFLSAKVWEQQRLSYGGWNRFSLAVWCGPGLKTRADNFSIDND